AGAPHTLQERRDTARRAQLANELHVADVDAELERSGRDQCTQLPLGELALGELAQILGQAAMVTGDPTGTQALFEEAGDALRLLARVGEYERRLVFANAARQFVVHLGPHLGRGDRLERGAGHPELDVQGAAVAGVDDRAGGLALTAGAAEVVADLGQRAHGGREPHALRRPTGALEAERFETLQGERQMGAAFARHERVNLVDDDGARRAEQASTAL